MTTRRLFKPALGITVGLWLLLGMAYPLAMTGLSHLMFPYSAQGSLIRLGGQVVGSKDVGQSFQSPAFFWLLPSDARLKLRASQVPDISPQDANLQIPRVSEHTGLSPAFLRQLVAQSTTGPEFGLFGPSLTNVLALNLKVYQAVHGTVHP